MRKGAGCAQGLYLRAASCRDSGEGKEWQGISEEEKEV